MKKLLIIPILLLSFSCFGQYGEISKSNNGNENFEMYFSDYPSELIISVDVDDVSMGEVAVFDTLRHLLYSKTSEDTRVHVMKSDLLGKKVLYISYRSRHYVIRKKYTIK